MVNVNQLKSRIVMGGYTQKEISQLMGLSEGALSNKINNKAAFYLCEVDLLCDILKITSNQEKIDIFLGCV